MLAKDEILIKQYDYAVTKSKHDTVMHSVIVTDRRIISQEQGGRSFERDEMPIDHADYILTDFDSYKRSVALSVFLFVLSVLLAVGGFVWSRFVEGTYWFLIPSGLAVVAVIFAVIALVVSLTKNGASAELEIRSRLRTSQFQRERNEALETYRKTQNQSGQRGCRTNAQRNRRVDSGIQKEIIVYIIYRRFYRQKAASEKISDAALF